MIIISILLSGITYISIAIIIYFRLIIAKTFLQCVFSRGGGMSHLTKYQEGKFSFRVASPKKTSRSHEEKITKRPPLGEKGSPMD